MFVPENITVDGENTLASEINNGSAPYELANKISELLTGRKLIFNLYPTSYVELGLLAFQIRHEILLAELAANLAFNRHTVERYLDLLEKVFVIFRV